MKKLIILFFVLATIVACQKQEVSDMTPLDETTIKARPVIDLYAPMCAVNWSLFYDFDNAIVRELLAGQTDHVGNVHIWKSGENHLYVKYILFDTDNTGFVETHVYVGNDLDLITNKKGNPKIGNFPGGDEVAPWEYSFPFPSGDFIVAAHCVVEFCDPILTLEEFAGTIPTSKILEIPIPRWDPPQEAYMWPVSLRTVCNEDPADDWDGDYPAWCLDPNKHIRGNTCYESNLYSSYDPASFPLGLFEYPENLDNVNWLMNQDPLNIDPGYTYGEVQIAIWRLVNLTGAPDGLVPTAPNWGLGLWDTDKADDLVELAMVEGEGFIPNCFENLIGVILVPQPYDEDIQPVLYFVPLECECSDETAWMTGSKLFVKKGGSWASYQEFFLECD